MKSVYSRGLSTQPCAKVLVLNVRFPNLTVRGLSVGKFCTQLQRKGVSLWARSLSVSLDEMTMLNAEL